MATGIQTSDPASKYISVVRMFDGAAAVGAVPTGAPSETPADGVGFAMSALGFGNVGPMDATLRVRSTAGTGTLAVTIRRWGYAVESGIWTPTGIGTGAAKGIINGGAALDETGTNLIRHAEPLFYVHHFDGIYFQITDAPATGGDALSLVIEILFPRFTR